MANFNRLIQSFRSSKHSSSQNDLSQNKKLDNSTSNQTLSSTTIIHHSSPILSLEIPSAQLLSNQFNPITNSTTQDDQIGEDVDLDSSSLSYLQSDRSTSPWVDLGHRITTFDSASHFLISGGDSLSPAGYRRCQSVHFGPTQLTELIRLSSPMILQRGLDKLGLFRPWRTAERTIHIGRLQLLFINYLLPSPPSTSESHQHEQLNPTLTTTSTHRSVVKVEDVQEELVFTLVHDLIHVLKWAIRHLSYQSSQFGFQTNWYEEFSREERQKGYPQNAYTSILLPLLPTTTQDLLQSIFELVSAVAAHVDQNAMPASHLCRILGFWILGHGTDSFVSFDHLYLQWEKSSRRFEHLFLAYLRSQSSKLPKRLKELISVYPLKPSALIFTPRFTTKMIKVLKVQITSFSTPVLEPIEPKQHENVNTSKRSSSLRRLPHTPSIRQATRTPSIRQATRTPSIRQATRTPSIRQVARSYSRSRRSVSIATSTPASIPPPQVPQPRGPLDILKTASEAVLSNGPDGELATNSPSYKIWQTALEQAKSLDHIPLTDDPTPDPLVSLLDNETLRVIQLTRPQVVTQPVTQEATPNLLTEPISASSKSSTTGRPRSFSLDVSPIHQSQPVHLTTLYEHSCSSRVLLSTKPFLEIPRTNTISQTSVASSPSEPTTSWADFVNSGFASSSQELQIKLNRPELIELPAPPRASISTVRSTATTVRSAATTVNQYKRRTITRKRRHKVSTSSSIRSFKPDEQLTTQIPTPPPPLPPIKPILRSVILVNVDETFSDVWLDTLGEPMIRSNWPNFLFSQLKKEISNSENDEKIHHLLIDESTLDSSFKGVEGIEGIENQSIIRSTDLVNPNGLEELGVITQSSINQSPNPTSSPIDESEINQPIQNSSTNSISSMFLSFGKTSKRWISSLFDDHHPHHSRINHKNKKNKTMANNSGEVET